jgi:hypothetical protein
MRLPGVGPICNLAVEYHVTKTSSTVTKRVTSVCENNVATSRALNNSNIHTI